MPALLIRISSLPNSGFYYVQHALDLLLVANISNDGYGTTTHNGDLLCHCSCGSTIDVSDSDSRAFAAQGQRDFAADATPCSGDKRYLIAKSHLLDRPVRHFPTAYSKC